MINSLRLRVPPLRSLRPFVLSLTLTAGAGAALAAGDIAGFNQYPVQTYDKYGDPEIALTKEQIGDPLQLEIEGVWKSRRLLVLGMQDTQILVSASDVVARDPDRIARLLGTAPSEDAIACLPRSRPRMAEAPGSKQRTTKGFGGAFCSGR